MKSHPTRGPDRFAGMNDTDEADRIEDVESELLWNLVCTPKGRIVKWPGFYPVTYADDLGLTDDSPKTKIHRMDRFRGKTGLQRGVMVVGSSMRRSGPNNIFDNWPEITFPATSTTPALNRVASFIFLNRYCYHQNGVDLPFRIKMEEDDGSAASAEAEILGLVPPLVPFTTAGSAGAGTLFPVDRRTSYAITYVYGNRGESGPSYVNNVLATANLAGIDLSGIPLGPPGVTARRLYRTKIGRGGNIGLPTQANGDSYYNAPPTMELFFLGELHDNTQTSFRDQVEDNALDPNRRLPPARPMPPVAKYQLVHQDRIAWANLREHPWVAVLAAMDNNANLTVVSATVTISNTGNGTITITFDGTPNGFDSTITISNYKTKTLKQIRLEINLGYGDTLVTDGAGASFNASARVFRVMPGVDENRTYRFREVTARSIAGGANLFAFEAIDDENDAVTVDGCERFPARVMWSNLGFVEEINPLNFADVSRHDLYPINGLFREDFTLGVGTQNDIWLLTGSFAADPFTFKPEFSIGRAQAEHGPLCPRPDACVQTPFGWIYPAVDGLRIFRGQTSTVFAHPINRRMFARLLREPRTRDNFFMFYESGILYAWFAGEEVQ